ncbi:MAG: hypothetical protein ACK2UE_15375 [Anaerolineales bacterium]
MVSISLDVPVEEGHLMQMGAAGQGIPCQIEFPSTGCYWSSQASLV